MPWLYIGIHVTEVVQKNHDISPRVDEAQENLTAFEEMHVAKWERVRSDIDHAN